MARGPKPKPFECPDPVFWYLVGLIATDGCLIGRGRVNITAKDHRYLALIHEAIGFRGGISKKLGGSGKIAHQLQIGSVLLWKRLVLIGLTPRKSLTIGRLDVPEVFFHDFLRGVIDGDGGIHRWIHPTNHHEQWAVKIFGASRPFLAWIQSTIEQLWGLKGRLHAQPQKRRHTLYVLKYGKLAAKVILARCYYTNALALERKKRLALKSASVTVGWAKSKTIAGLGAWRNWKYTRTNTSQEKRGDPDPSSGFVREPSVIWSAGVAKLAEARDLKSCVPIGTCGFESHPRHSLEAVS